MHEVVEGFLHQVLTLGVERRGGLVEDEDGRVLEDGSGNAYALPLAAREFAATVANVGVKSLLGCHDEVVGIGNARCLLHLLARGVLHSKGDVVVERVVEENRLLVHVAHEGTKLCHAVVAQIHTVDGDAALVHVVESRQQVGNSCLSRATLPHECHRLATGDVDAHAVDYPSVLVAEAHVTIADALLERG